MAFSVSFGRALQPAFGGDVETEGPWWDPDNDGLCIWGAYLPKGAASFAASLTDLSGNGNNAIDPGGADTPAWTSANGWDFGASQTEHLETTFTMQADQSQTMIARFDNITDVGTRYLCGKWDGGGSGLNYFWLICAQLAGNMRYGNGNQSVVAPFINNGIMCVAGNQGYRNGLPDGAPIGAGNAGVQPVYIGARNLAGVPDGGYNGRMQVFALYDCALTAAQVLSVSASIALL